MTSTKKLTSSSVVRVRSICTAIEHLDRVPCSSPIESLLMANDTEFVLADRNSASEPIAKR